MKLGPSALFIATVLLLHRALADNVTTSFILPDGIFFPSAVLLSFVGQSSISSGTTSYTVLCPEALWGFEPGSGCQGYSGYSSYTFSEYQSTTQYVMPEYETPFLFMLSLSMNTFFPGMFLNPAAIFSVKYHTRQRMRSRFIFRPSSKRK